ncbi:MAG: hypothetical protein FWF05_01165 [Oscillospiraceae bacterium]|nr:hypothetical protein [Oscillospiraceae bacterium]
MRKSLTAISIAGRLYLEGKIRRVLVVAPLPIVGVWDEEFAKFAAFDYTLAVLNGTGTKKADTTEKAIEGLRFVQNGMRSLILQAFSFNQHLEQSVRDLEKNPQ